MSYAATGTGRVKSIKSKFENLNTIESLDISATVPTKYRKPSPKFLFKRSSTSIDLPINRIAVANINNNNNNNNNNKNNNNIKNVFGKTSTVKSLSMDVEAIKSSLRQQHNNIDRTISADAFCVKKRNLVVQSDSDTLKPLKEIKENVEIRLMRHTNDPVKRSSIKRSPAFRVGDKSTCNNANNSTKLNLNKTNRIDNGNSDVIVPPVVPNEFAAKFENLLKRCDIETRQDFHESGLTDTLKAVLRQPLPSGPPPKKPPRTFIDSPKQGQKCDDDSHECDDNGNVDDDDDDDDDRGSVIKSRNHTSDMKQKIDLLENQLQLKSHTKSKATRNATPATATTKEKHPFSSSLLNCIPCSSASIYDTIIVGHNQFGKVITSKEPLSSSEKMHIKTTQQNSHALYHRSLTTQKQQSRTEPIYMEPFAHLKHRPSMNGSTPIAAYGAASGKHCTNSNFCVSSSSPSNEPKPPSTSSISNGSFDGPDSLGSSLTSCTSCTADDHSITDLHDIHYMCTSIENKLKSSDSDSNSNENDQPITLSNTYDEINILVNAAFGHHKTNDEMGNTDSFQVSPSMSHSSVSEFNEPTQQQQQQQQQQKTFKLSRKLTEKRKDYVRRVSAVSKQMPESILSNDSTLHQTFKPSVFRTFSIDNEDDETSHNECTNTIKPSSPPKCGDDQLNSIDRNGNVSENRKSDATSHNDIDDDEDNSSIVCDEHIVGNVTKLFQVCLLVGYNISTRQAYIKSKFPTDEDIPPNIEQLVFPSPNLINETRKSQDYSIILTDNNGYHVYGYCRRILPESCEICLPLAYCLISEVKAPGFYFKILKEIETRHGQAEFQTNFLLQTLQTRSIPDAGKFLHVKLPLSPKPKTISTTHHKIMPKRLSLEVNPKWLTESAAQAAFSNCETINTTTIAAAATGGAVDLAMPSKKERSTAKSLVQEFEEKKLMNNGAPFDLSLINRSLFNGRSNGKCDEIFIRRPNDLRLESMELSDLYEALGPDLLIVVFSTLLLERKVILYTENISILSSCVLGLQTILYPFQWQHTIITILPESLVDICQAPIPVLAGLLEPINFDIEDGIVIDLNTRTLVQKCGDETTILPSSLMHSLKVSLEMVDLLDQGKMLSSVLIAEAFLRCFVELFVAYKHKEFDKRQFIESHSSQSYRLFLEWFVETAMFRHFIHQKFTQTDMTQNATSAAAAAWIADMKFYDLFDSRILKSENESSSTQHNMEMIMKNCKVINKKGKTFKDRFKDFISSNNN